MSAHLFNRVLSFLFVCFNSTFALALARTFEKVSRDSVTCQRASRARIEEQLSPAVSTLPSHSRGPWKSSQHSSNRKRGRAGGGVELRGRAATDRPTAIGGAGVCCYADVCARAGLRQKRPGRAPMRGPACTRQGGLYGSYRGCCNGVRGSMQYPRIRSRRDVVHKKLDRPEKEKNSAVHPKSDAKYLRKER